MTARGRFCFYTFILKSWNYSCVKEGGSFATDRHLTIPRYMEAIFEEEVVNYAHPCDGPFFFCWGNKKNSMY